MADASLSACLLDLRREVLSLLEGRGDDFRVFQGEASAISLRLERMNDSLRQIPRSLPADVATLQGRVSNLDHVCVRQDHELTRITGCLDSLADQIGQITQRVRSLESNVADHEREIHQPCLKIPCEDPAPKAIWISQKSKLGPFTIELRFDR